MALENNRIKAICFDIDGTLSDTDDQIVKRLGKILSPAKFIFRHRDVVPFTRRVVMLSEGPGNWIFSMADRLGLDNSLVALEDFLFKIGIEHSPEPYLLIYGVREMLIELKKHYLLSIISARDQKLADRFLSQFELQDFFTAVATSQTCEHTKPFPDPLFWAAEKMGVKASECLMVGDTVVDILTGKHAGAQTVGVLCGFGEENELRHAGADLVVRTTPDVVGFI